MLNIKLTLMSKIELVVNLQIIFKSFYFSRVRKFIYKRTGLYDARHGS